MATMWLSIVITCAAFAAAGYFYAKQTGRNPVRWAIGGAVLNVLILGFMVWMGGSPKIRRLNIT